MKILVTGSNGMLGRALCQELGNKYELIGMDVLRNQKSEIRNQKFLQCDITDRKKTIAEIGSIRPDLLIHAAAYTDVDGCEQNPAKAHQVNAQGTETVALAAKNCGAFIFYISTDFVFDGKKESAYREQDRPNPINIYGQSKLKGEIHIQTILNEFIVIRSSWLFGRGGRSFVEAILNKAQNHSRIEVVQDQCGSPTYTKDLARAISRLISLTKKIKGTYHITNSGSCSWYQFAQAIKELSGLDTEIVPISSSQYHALAQRPQMSILANSRFRECTGEGLRHWKEALKEYLQEPFC